MKRLTLMFAVMLLLPVRAPGGETVSRVAAVVNDEIITTYELNSKMAGLADPQADALPPEEKQALRRQVLSRLIEEALIRQRGEELQIEVSDEEVEAAIDDIQRQNDLGRQELIEALRFQGVSFDEYRQNMRDQIMRFKLVGREVQARIDVTSREVRDYFREHIDDYREEPSVRLSRLSFPIPGEATRVQIEALREKAKEALARLQKGEEFTAVMLSYTADQSAEGGDMGHFSEGELTPAFDRVVRDLDVGQISDLIETPAGFHILHLVERSPGKVRQFDSVEDEIQRILREQRTDERLKEWSAELKEEAYIDIRL